MKKLTLFAVGVTALFLVAMTSTTLAAASDKGKEVTITGEAKCAKCALKVADKCQTVVQVEKKGKTVNYYLADNEVAKGFHESVCSGSKKVTVTGTVKRVNGKRELAATKIDLNK